MQKHKGVKYKYKGKRKTIPEWAEEYGIPSDVLYMRVFIRKWDIEKALTQPVKQVVQRKEREFKKEKRPNKLAPGCIYPDCFHCPLPDCRSN